MLATGRHPMNAANAGLKSCIELAAEPLATAALAMLMGVGCYVWLRPLPAAFLPEGWHHPMAHALPPLLTGAAPTFVHTLAMSLLLMVAAGTSQRLAKAAVCAAWCGLELACEVAQHPSVGQALLAAWPTDMGAVWGYAALAGFVRSGTFDPLDVAAALLGSMAAYLIDHRSV